MTIEIGRTARILTLGTVLAVGGTGCGNMKNVIGPESKSAVVTDAAGIREAWTITITTDANVRQEMGTSSEICDVAPAGTVLTVPVTHFQERRDDTGDRWGEFSLDKLNDDIQEACATDADNKVYIASNLFEIDREEF